MKEYDPRDTFAAFAIQCLGANPTRAYGGETTAVIVVENAGARQVTCTFLDTEPETLGRCLRAVNVYSMLDCKHLRPVFSDEVQRRIDIDRKNQNNT